jgi:hypothetical protein
MRVCRRNRARSFFVGLALRHGKGCGDSAVRLTVRDDRPQPLLLGRWQYVEHPASGRVGKSDRKTQACLQICRDHAVYLTSPYTNSM